MGGKGSGGYRGPNKFSNSLKITEQDPDANKRIMSFSASFLKFDLVDFTDGEAQWERFEFMLKMCDKYDVRPNVPALSMSLGLRPNSIYSLLKHEWKTYHGHEVTTLFVENLQKMYDFIQTYLEAALLDEEKNPVKWLFLAKNHFGYTDSRENVIKTVQEKPQLESADAVAKRYRKKLGKGENEIIEVQNLKSVKPRKAKAKVKK